MHSITSENRDKLKESGEGYMGVFGGRKQREI